MSVRAVVAAADREEEDWTGITERRGGLRELCVLSHSEAGTRAPSAYVSLHALMCAASVVRACILVSLARRTPLPVNCTLVAFWLH